MNVPAGGRGAAGASGEMARKSPGRGAGGPGAVGPPAARAWPPAGFPPLVARSCGVGGAPAWGEWRWMEQDGAEGLPWAVEPPQLVEGIARHDLSSIGDVVQLEVFVRPRVGFRRRLQTHRAARARHEGVAGEAGGVGERVEDVTPAGVGGDPEPVFELVEIEAGLVTP